MAEPMYWRMTGTGISKPAIMTIISRRVRASRVSLAWMVVRLPSWPVFMACSMSSASAPRHLADDDAVGPHTQGVADQIALLDLADAFEVGRPRLQPDHVRLLQLQLGRVLDGDQPFVARGCSATAC